MCLDIHAKFRGDRPRDLKGGGGGGQIDPPSKNLLSKSPVKIGLSFSAVAGEKNATLNYMI